MYTVIYTSISNREGRLVVFLVVVWLRTGNLKISGYVRASMTLGKSDKTSHYSRTVTMLWVSWGYWNGSFTMLYMCVCVLLCRKYKKEEWWKQDLMEWMVSPQLFSQWRFSPFVILRRIQEKSDYLSKETEANMYNWISMASSRQNGWACDTERESSILCILFPSLCKGLLSHHSQPHWNKSAVCLSFC